MTTRSGLIVVDLQNDFCPGGALAVPDGHLVVPVLNRYVRRFVEAAAPVYASRDWHPEVTRHFRDYGGIWPNHCVQGTLGAEFHPDLQLGGADGAIRIVTKGADPNEDAYSAFQAVDENGMPLADALRRDGVERVFVGGLATDYCVKATVLDALRLGFGATLLLDGSRGVNLKPHDSEQAIEEMVSAGANVTTARRHAQC